jgi:Protein of unknown function, DUF481
MPAYFCSARTAVITLAAAWIALCAGRAEAQAPSATQDAVSRVPWHGSVEANGNILYGAASQRVFAGAASTSRLGSDFEWRFDVLGSYGDSRDQKTGLRSVIARNARISTAFDLHPHNTVSAFAFASAESNFQQRYKSRTAAGAGAKYTFWHPDSVIGGFVQDASISIALLAEQTRLLNNAPPASIATAGNRTRWSVRWRFRKRINEHVRFSHQTLYQPTTNGLERYTLDAVTELAVPVRTRLQLTISHRERLDSEAVKRGAPSVRDGQVVFGVRATF